MILQVYAIYDVRAKAYMQPFFMDNEEMAKRAVMDCVNSESHGFHKHAEDYSLYCLGSFDDSLGQIEGTGPRFIVSAKALKDVMEARMEKKRVNEEQTDLVEEVERKEEERRRADQASRILNEKLEVIDQILRHANEVNPDSDLEELAKHLDGMTKPALERFYEHQKSLNGTQSTILGGA